MSMNGFAQTAGATVCLGRGLLKLEHAVSASFFHLRLSAVSATVILDPTLSQPPTGSRAHRYERSLIHLTPHVARGTHPERRQETVEATNWRVESDNEN